jgi:hypothetical protein
MTPRQRTAARSLVLGGGIAAVLGVLHWLGVGLRLLFALGVVLAFVGLVLPHVGVRWLDAAVLWLRSRFWAPEEGRFHSFGGVPLDVHDDGRHVWLGAHGLQQALGRSEPEAALAARHAGRWRRSGRDQALQLRADAVVTWLATMPGRDEPRVQRLRRYVERELLFPAAERRRRQETMH